MTLYSSPPAPRTFRDDKPTLLVCWWCTLFAGTIIFFRVCGRYIRSEKLFREDWIAMACTIPLYARMAMVHVVLLYGTNNVIVTVGGANGMSEEEMWKRSVGSRLVLASRIFYAATLWMLKLTISEFFKRLVPLHLWKPSYERVFQSIRYFLVFTFLAIIIADLAECIPITHYWLVSPTTPPQCRQGYAQLLTMGIANVITDLLLVFFPIPIIVTSSTMSLKRKFQLTCLFALSLVPVVVTLYRLPEIIKKHGSQQTRSLWASIEILFATAVANALVLGSFVRDRGVKKLKYKLGSFTDSMERQSSRRGTVVRHWGSDEDLVRDLGMAVDPELRDEEDQHARPAPMANGLARGALNSNGNGHHSAVNQAWRFPRSNSDASSNPPPTDMSLNSPGDVSSLLTNNTSRDTPRKVSFFDVGGLLDSPTPSDQSPLTTRKASVASRERDLQYNSSGNGNGSNGGGGVRRGSAALLQDIGGLLSAGPRVGGSRKASTPGFGLGMEMQSLPEERIRSRSTPGELQDVGGLLR